MSAKILDGREIAKDILEEESEKVSELKLSGWDPKLISIKVGENPAVDLYIRNQRHKAEQAGIIFEEKEYPKDISTNELQAAISNFNVDPKVTGIFLQRPVPESIPIKILQKAIHPLKDVEGMHPTSIGNIIQRTGTRPMHSHGFSRIIEKNRPRFAGIGCRCYWALRNCRQTDCLPLDGRRSHSDSLSSYD